MTKKDKNIFKPEVNNFNFDGFSSTAVRDSINYDFEGFPATKSELTSFDFDGFSSTAVHDSINYDFGGFPATESKLTDLDCISFPIDLEKNKDLKNPLVPEKTNIRGNLEALRELFVNREKKNTFK